jgi:hypothetical protein
MVKRWPISAAIMTVVVMLAACSGGNSADTPLTTPPVYGGPTRALSIETTRLYATDFLYFEGESTLPEGTALQSQLSQNGEVLGWWPSQTPILVEDGRWEIKASLGVGGAPSRLQTAMEYDFRVWEASDPSVQAEVVMSTLFASPRTPWWPQAIRSVGEFFDDLFHGRLWRTAPPVPPNYPISRDMAVIIAGKQLPARVVKEASLSTGVSEGVWRINFVLLHSLVTRSELGWQDDTGTTYGSTGGLPEDTYRLLTIQVSATTGTVLSREASGGFIVGPLDGETERRSNAVPPWTNIASGLGGLLVGGGTVWVVMRRMTKRGK